VHRSKLESQKSVLFQYTDSDNPFGIFKLKT